VSNLLTLQTELERFLRNPAIRLGVFGPAASRPWTHSMTGRESSWRPRCPGWSQQASTSLGKVTPPGVKESHV